MASEAQQRWQRNAFLAFKPGDLVKATCWGNLDWFGVVISYQSELYVVVHGPRLASHPTRIIEGCGANEVFQVGNIEIVEV